MDIFRKMFGKSKIETAETKDEFRKPTWYEESETDDELFDNHRSFMFQIFTNPLEIQKHFDRQMQEILKSLKQDDDNLDDFFNKNPRDEYMKPGFEDTLIKEFTKHSDSLDTDLDGEIYADQLHSLLQRLNPEIRKTLQENKKLKPLKMKQKMRDEDVIMGRIHGTLLDESATPVVKRKEIFVPKMSPHFGGVFEGTYQGPKTFGQSIMTQTIRKPDGTSETKRIIRDSDGNVKTTITRTIDGKSETVTTYGKGGEKNVIEGGKWFKRQGNAADVDAVTYGLPSDRNIYVTPNGYALPKNLW